MEWICGKPGCNEFVGADPYEHGRRTGHQLFVESNERIRKMFEPEPQIEVKRAWWWKALTYVRLAWNWGASKGVLPSVKPGPNGGW